MAELKLDSKFPDSHMHHLPHGQDAYNLKFSYQLDNQNVTGGDGEASTATCKPTFVQALLSAGTSHLFCPPYF